MKRLRRIVFNASLIVFIISVVLLLNITAPNPTHRRYSSQMPVTTGQGNPNQIGASAEIILSEDLRLPNNNQADQRQCLCKSVSLANGKDCNLCLPVNDLQTSFRIPDFIAPDFIAESKNVLNLRYPGDVFDQISDYALAAKLLNRPLWVYVRVDTTVAPDFYEIVHSTGGNVIPYFTVPGYVDPIDDIAQKTVVVSGAIILSFVWINRRSRQVQKSLPILVVPISTNPSNGEVGIARKITHVEDFTARAKARLQAQVDAEDEWNDL